MNDSIGALNQLKEINMVELLAPPQHSAPDSPSSHHAPGVTSSTEEKALALLGAGIQQEAVAAAIGVTPARISQLLSDKSFADKVARLRYDALQKHNARDLKYDTLEDRLLDKLDKSLPLLIRPESILNAMRIVNAAKRRGAQVQQTNTQEAKIVQLIVPTFIAQQFSVNMNNQVIKAGSQELLTMQASQLLKQFEQKALTPPITQTTIDNQSS
jgi:transcriptional regulator with XRE-family HTH domain